MPDRPRFHFAFPVRDLAEARLYYGDLLDYHQGRSNDAWEDFDFIGHQIIAHLSPNEATGKDNRIVDSDQVPVRHFGAILSTAEWRKFTAQLREKGVSFVMEPDIRFESRSSEQATFFFARLQRQCAEIQGVPR